MENVIIQKRLQALRECMKQKNIDFYLVTTADFHCSEYVHDHFKCREFLSGFTGSNGNLVVSAQEAGLWTDGRYFVQAEKELEGTGIELFRMLNEGVETIEEYLLHHMKKGQTLGFDGRCVDASYGLGLERALADLSISISYNVDIPDEIWDQRPELPKNPIWLMQENRCGYTFEEKLELVRGKMKQLRAEYFVLSKLDDLMWLLNIRGNDVACNPVALSYGIVSMRDFTLFIQQEEITSQADQYFRKKKITVKPYEDILTDLQKKDWENGKVLVDPDNISYALLKTIAERTEIVRALNPTEWYKAVKTEEELKQIREVYLEDSAAVCKFIYWLKQNIGKTEITEISAAEKMDALRADIHDFIELSFPTISAYRENAAMMHYEATKEHFKVLEREGMLLVDSGGQYERGTTDVTRTIVIGPISDEIKLHFSKTAAGMLQMAAAKFLYGCAGRNVDILAREPLWELGIDYKCGTGHGIGFVLNVHEGPQGIRWKYVNQAADTPLEKGMIISDEPGVYIAGSHGIRTENILEVVSDVHNGDGQFMAFRMLTFVPIDREALDTKYLSEKDIQRIDSYHQQVYEKVSPYMTQEERDWLYDATRPLSV